MAAKKKAAARAAKKTSSRKATASRKKAAPKKKAAAKKKAAPKKKAAAKKRAAPKKKAAAKKKAAPKKKAAARKKAGAAPAEAEAAEAAEAPAPIETPPPEAAAEAPAPREPLPELPRTVSRGRRRRLAANGGENGDRRAPKSARPAPPVRARRPIPPLPDDEEDYVPPVSKPAPTPARPPPRKRRKEMIKPEDVLAAVRRGEKHVSALGDLSNEEILALAQKVGLKPRSGERRGETVYRLLNKGGAPKEPDLAQVDGLLELHPDGYGFLRQPSRNYSQHPEDVYVSAGLVRRLGLKPGHWISGRAHRPRPNQPYLALKDVEEVNHEDPERLKDIVVFEKLTVVFPDSRLVLETTQDDIEMRVMDLFCPLGRGQRGLIVAPPRTGKTIMLQKLADAIATNSPDVDIVVLLVDERPEEVTNMRRSVRGEVVASTFDKPASNHIRVAELVMEKVKRLVEFGRHVVLLLDSITRMGRAYNNQTGGSGRILTGGLDANALTKPKRFFGSARNVEDGGSLTIVATALVDTGSKMDEVIFEEFKGTGNMELVLSRDMANARVWPAIDVPSSGTRNEDLLMHPDELRRVTLLRRGITGQDPQSVMLALRDQMKKNISNAEFLMALGN